MVRLLVVAGAEIESRDHRGNTPLMHASREVKKDKKKVAAAQQESPLGMLIGDFESHDIWVRTFEGICCRRGLSALKHVCPLELLESP